MKKWFGLIAVALFLLPLAAGHATSNINVNGLTGDVEGAVASASIRAGAEDSSVARSGDASLGTGKDAEAVRERLEKMKKAKEFKHRIKLKIRKLKKQIASSIAPRMNGLISRLERLVAKLEAYGIDTSELEEKLESAKEHLKKAEEADSIRGKIRHVKAAIKDLKDFKRLLRELVKENRDLIRSMGTPASSGSHEDDDDEKHKDDDEEDEEKHGDDDEKHKDDDEEDEEDDDDTAVTATPEPVNVTNVTTNKNFTNETNVTIKTNATWDSLAYSVQKRSTLPVNTSHSATGNFILVASEIPDAFEVGAPERVQIFYLTTNSTNATAAAPGDVFYYDPVSKYYKKQSIPKTQYHYSAGEYVEFTYDFDAEKVKVILPEMVGSDEHLWESRYDDGLAQFVDEFGSTTITQVRYDGSLVSPGFISPRGSMLASVSVTAEVILYRTG